MAISDELIRRELLQIVVEAAGVGAGRMQSPGLLQEAVDRLGIRRDSEDELALLDVWQELFTEGILAWGHDVHNANPPFMHVTRKGRVQLGIS